MVIMCCWLTAAVLLFYGNINKRLNPMRPSSAKLSVLPARLLNIQHQTAPTKHLIGALMIR